MKVLVRSCSSWVWWGARPYHFSVSLCWPSIAYGLQHLAHGGTQYEIIFCQLPNSQFSSILAKTSESMSPRNVLKGIFKNFQFMGHLPPKTSKFKGSQTGPLFWLAYSPGTHCTEIMLSCSQRAREFPISSRFLYMIYGFGATVCHKFPQFSHLPIFPIQNA